MGDDVHHTTLTTSGVPALVHYIIWQVSQATTDSMAGDNTSPASTLKSRTFTQSFPIIYFRTPTHTSAQWEILAIFGSLQNPDSIQILGPKELIFLILVPNFSHIFKFSRPKMHKKYFFELQNSSRFTSVPKIL